jgi:hypothetical protein
VAEALVLDSSPDGDEAGADLPPDAIPAVSRSQANSAADDPRLPG